MRYYLEQRRHPRVERNTDARIIIVGQRLRVIRTLSCKVINTSKGGALIDPLGADVPDYFYLEIKGEPDRASCAIVRREGPYIGVQFF